MIISEQLILAAQAGSKNAIFEIVDKCLPFIKRIAHKYITNKNELEDFIQDGCVMILDCLSKYNPDSNYSFNTYVTKSFIKKIIKYLNKETSTYITYSYPEICDQQENIEETSLDERNMESSSYEEILPCDEDTLEVARTTDNIKHDYEILQEELTNIMRKALNEADLKIIERCVIESIYGLNREERSSKQLAKDYHTTDKNISYIKKRALKKLRQTPTLKNIYK